MTQKFEKQCVQENWRKAERPRAGEANVILEQERGIETKEKSGGFQEL